MGIIAKQGRVQVIDEGLIAESLNYPLLLTTNSNLRASPDNGLSRNTVSSYPNNRMKKRGKEGC